MSRRALSSAQEMRSAMEPKFLELDQIKLIPNHNPRNFMVSENPFSEEALAQLVESINEQGVLVPILVRRIGMSDDYQLVAGERRYQASRQAGLEKIPVFVQEITDDQLFEVAAIENTQRQNLSPDALGIQALHYIARRLEIETRAVPAAVNKIRNGGEDPRDIKGLLRRVFNLGLDQFSSTYAKVGELTQDERKALLAGRFGINALIPLIKLGERVERKELLDQLVGGEISAEKLKLEVQRLTFAPIKNSLRAQEIKKAIPKINKLTGTKKEEIEVLMEKILEILNSK